MAKTPKKPKGTPGPEPERLKIEGDWEAAASKVVQAKKPAGGWPGAKKKPKSR